MKVKFRKTALVFVSCIIIFVMFLVISGFSGCDFKTLEERSSIYIEEIARDFDVLLPKGITPKYLDSEVGIDGGVIYYYYETETDPTACLKESSTIYQIDRDTFVKWLNSAMKEIADYGAHEVVQRIKEEYKPRYTDTENYFCYMIKTERRFIYLYVVYNMEENSLIVCREVNQYAKERYTYN